MKNIIAFKLKNGVTINILDKIGDDFDDFGKKLLNDALMKMIKYEFGGHQDPMIIVDMWMAGRGRRPVSWETLVTVLYDIGYVDFAKDIHEGAPYQQE